ncbi:hypothetical protein niasHT_002674 [Heterodera trifolii]|uniref:Uncharacterized protein n=1 Tax=Heterodera trifolii TaxID=157864 RepID=A0ABD2MFD6_9BILA
MRAKRRICSKVLLNNAIIMDFETAAAEKRRILSNCMKVIETLRFLICRQLKSKPEAKDLLASVHNRLQQVIPINAGAPIDDTYHNFLNEHLSKTGRMITQFADSPATTVDDMRSFAAYLSTYTNQLEGRNSHLL